jgi:DNA (cytosine-5)-methyltransferase 1
MESNYRGVVNGRTHTEDGRWELGRRDFGQPSFTITGRAPKIVVPGHSTTRLLPAQMGVLQTFPADFPWRGNLGQQRLQAGNAIPPVLAYVILRQFRNN